jgi:preprotein translocase subunit SecE
VSKKGAASPGSQRPPLGTRIKQFLVEAWLELRKVLWPSKQEAIRFTMVVLGVIAVVALFIYICDIILTQLSGPLFNIRP